MSDIAANLASIQHRIKAGVQLVAVSKTQPVASIEQAYAAGQRVFGENRAQEMTAKHAELPADIEWHMIGHLQRNKVKYIAPYVALIHSVDNRSLLQEIEKEARKNKRVIPCLIQVYIATEESKFGFEPDEVRELFKEDLKTLYPHVKICGLMGMASFSHDADLVRNEFRGLNHLFQELNRAGHTELNTLSMGMSGDFELAITEGSTMVRVGSSIFGARH